MRLARPLLFTSLTLGLIAPAARAFDGGAWTVGKGEWYSEMQGFRSSASDFFQSNGDAAALPDNGRNQSMGITSYSEIGWKKNLSLSILLPFESHVSSTGAQTLSVTGLSDLALGLRLRLKESQPGLVIDAGWKAPLGYEKNLEPTLGNGRQELFGAAHIGLELPKINGFVQASRGMRFVGELSDVRINTTADLAAWIGKRVLVGGRYFDEGVWSSTSAISEAPHSYAAGPVLLVRMDERLDLSAGSFYQWAGHNVDKTMAYYVSVGFRQTRLNRLEGFLGTTKFQ